MAGRIPPALLVACPTCAAQAGSGCTGAQKRFHATRANAARARTKGLDRRRAAPPATSYASRDSARATRKQQRKGRTLPLEDARDARRRLDALGFASLAEYTQSSHWRGVRARWKLGQGRAQSCEICGGGWLVLHHLNYHSLGREEDDDLVALCVRCHTGVHRLIGRGTVGVTLVNAHLHYVPPVAA